MGYTILVHDEFLRVKTAMETTQTDREKEVEKERIRFIEERVSERERIDNMISKEDRINVILFRFLF